MARNSKQIGVTPYRRLAVSEVDRLGDETGAQADDRVVRFCFATPNVALDGHRILPGAWEGKGHDGLAAFRQNPVFLWAHRQDELPVGKVTKVGEKDGVLSGAVRFADHPFAEATYRAYKDGFLRGASVSWLPVSFKYASGPNRAPGAIDFERVMLLEISATPLPADQSALSVMRSLGLDPGAVRSMTPKASEGLQVAQSPLGKLITEARSHASTLAARKDLWPSEKRMFAEKAVEDFQKRAAGIEGFQPHVLKIIRALFDAQLSASSLH